MTTSISIKFDNEDETSIISATAEVYYQPCESATRDYPGCDASLSIESLKNDETGEDILIDAKMTRIVEEAFEEYLKSERDADAYARYESRYGYLFS